jgi:hypothetical protein
LKISKEQLKKTDNLMATKKIQNPNNDLQQITWKTKPTNLTKIQGRVCNSCSTGSIHITV